MSAFCIHRTTVIIIFMVCKTCISWDPIRNTESTLGIGNWTDIAGNWLYIWWQNWEAELRMWKKTKDWKQEKATPNPRLKTDRRESANGTHGWRPPLESGTISGTSNRTQRRCSRGWEFWHTGREKEIPGFSFLFASFPPILRVPVTG